MPPLRLKLRHVATGICLLVPLTACRMVQSTAELPGKTVSLVASAGKPKPPAVDPVEVQQVVLRLADEFAAAIAVSVDHLRRGTKALDTAESLQWKLSLNTEAVAIASGPNAYANLLDLTVFVTVVNAAVEEHWLPNVFGESARAILESCRSVETNLWVFTDKVLVPTQRTELRAAIRAWRVRNPQPEIVLSARAVGFASQVAGASKTDPAQPGSVFNLLLIDPLAGMDPAVREIAQSRLFAERALYVTQKMPRLVRWQTELLTLHSLRLPAVQQVISNSTQITTSVDSFAQFADQLPKLVNDQREAAIKQVLDGAASERTNLIASLADDAMKLRPTLVELRQTLGAGNELMKSAETTVKSLDTFMTRFDAGTNAPAATTTNARPFDILDYATAAKEFTATIQELNATINSLDKTVPQIQQAGEMLERTGLRLLHRLFVVGAGLVVFLWVGALATVLAFRKLNSKDSPAPAPLR